MFVGRRDMGSNLKICLSQHRQVSPNSEVWTCENGRRTVLHSVAYDVCQVQPGNQSSKFPVETRPMSSRCFFWRKGDGKDFQSCLSYNTVSRLPDLSMPVFSCLRCPIHLRHQRRCTHVAVVLWTARTGHACSTVRSPRLLLAQDVQDFIFSKLAGFNSILAVNICRSADVPMLTICDCTHIIYMLCVHDAFWIELNLKLTCLFTLLDIIWTSSRKLAKKHLPCDCFSEWFM